VGSPYRIAAPPKPEPPDQVDVYEGELLRRLRRGKLALLGTYALLAASSIALTSVRHRESDRGATRELGEIARRRASVRSALDRARAKAKLEQARFEVDLLAAADRDLAPSPGAPACPIRLPEPSLSNRASFPLLIVSRGDRDLPSPSVSALLADIERAERHLAAGRIGTAELYADALDRSPPPLARDVVIVTSSMKHPARTTSTSFEPGEASGRAYLYDFGEHRVTCVGDVHAASSPSIAYAYATGAASPAAQDQGPQLTASLDADLDAQLRRATRAALAERP
jgi:hypothetical protein